WIHSRVAPDPQRIIGQGAFDRTATRPHIPVTLRRRLCARIHRTAPGVLIAHENISGTAPCRPATKGCPSASCPERCQRMTPSVTGRKRLLGHSAHLIRGFSHTPFTHSFAHAGAYPALPVFRLSKRRGYTSSRPRKSDRKRRIFSSEDECWS